MMNLSQTKLVGLTMELDLKAREYKKLCDQLDKLKESQINPNDKELIVLRELFQRNHDDIVRINMQIKEIKETQISKKYIVSDMFYNKNNLSKIEAKKMPAIQNEKNIFAKFIYRIKTFFKNE